MEEEALDRLVVVLVTEIGLLKDLHALLAAQQDALVKGDVDAVKQSVEGQIATLGEIARLERDRIALLGSLETVDDVDRKNLTLSNLIDAAPAHGKRLCEVRAALKDVLEGIGKVNKQNGMLINQSLAYIGKTLKTIAGEDSAATVYTAEGHVTCPTGRLAVDREI